MILHRIVEARLEFVALTNASVLAVTTFGIDVTDDQQMAITGVVNALFIVAWRVIKGTPTVTEALRSPQ